MICYCYTVCLCKKACFYVSQPTISELSPRMKLEVSVVVAPQSQSYSYQLQLPVTVRTYSLKTFTQQ